MNKSRELGNLTRQSFANGTGCELGLYRVVRKKQLELEGVDSTSIFTDLDSYVNRTDLKTLIGELNVSCYNDDEFKLLKTILNHFWNPPVYFGFGVLGNLLIIIFFLQMYAKKLSKMSSYHFMIVNIAVADLFVCSYFAKIRDISSESSSRRFECVFFSPFRNSVCPAASVWLLTLLSYARYRLVVKPFQPKMTKKKCTLFVIACWIVSFCTSLILFVNVRYSDDSKSCYSALTLKQWKINNTTIFVFESLITLFLMLYFYCKIKKKLLENDLRLPRQSSSQKRNRTALKTIKYLLIIYATTTCFGRLLYGFAIFIKLIIDEESLFGKRKMNVYLWLFEDAIALLGLSNNVVNIFVYIKMIPDFRRFLLTIFSFGRCGREQKKLTDGM